MSYVVQEFVHAGTVMHAFTVPKRGLALMPNKGFSARVVAGTRIQLRTSDGKVIETEVKSVARVSGRDLPNPFAFVLPEEISAHSIPEGTAIWVLSTSEMRTGNRQLEADN